MLSLILVTLEGKCSYYHLTDKETKSQGPSTTPPPHIRHTHHRHDNRSPNVGREPHKASLSPEWPTPNEVVLFYYCLEPT